MNEEPPPFRVYDPDRLARVIDEAYGANVRAAENLRDYALNSLPRLLVTSVKQPSDLAIIGALYRHVVASFEGALRLLAGGAVYTACQPTRAIIEGVFAIDWALRDPVVRGTRLYVASLRRRRDWNARGIPGTSGHTWLQCLHRDRFGEAPEEFSANEQAFARQEHDRLERVLTSPPFAESNRAFDEQRKDRDHDPAWYELGADGVGSFAAMAKRLGREVEYRVVYDSLSSAVHGGDLSRHTADGPTGRMLRGVLDVREFDEVFLHAVTYALEAVRTVIGHYRPDELDIVRGHYDSSWRAALDLPEVEFVSRTSGYV